MKIYKNILIAFMFAFLISLQQVSAASKTFIVKKDGKKMNVKSITATKTGILTIKAGNTTTKLKPGQYKYARIPAPKDLLQAKRSYNSKDYSAAASAFDKTYIKYKFLGWGTFSLYYEMKSLEKLKRMNDLLQKAKELRYPEDPEEEKFFFKAKQLEATVLIARKQTKEAAPILKLLAKSTDDESAMFANNAKGDILTGEGNENAALYYYMRNLILFKPCKSTTYNRSIDRVVEILKAQNDPRADEFAKMKL